MQGTQGVQGESGFQGLQGPRGKDGNFGGASFDYTFDTNTDFSDPGTGRLKFDNSDYTLASKLYLDDLDDYGTDIQGFLSTIDQSTSIIKGHFRITRKFDPSVFALFTITSITGQGSGPGTGELTGYWEINCDYVVGSSTTFTNNEDIIITFARIS